MVARETASTTCCQPPIPKLLVIVGPTASGKTALGIELAKRLNGEIICADSRTVYKYMDIGTAKPTDKEKQGIKHHLLDLVEPDENFTAAMFKKLALDAIEDIRGRGKLPIMVGGSGLYVDAVLYDYDFAEAIVAKRDEQNPRHRVAGSSHSKKPLMKGALVIGLNPERSELKQKLKNRVDTMIEEGFVVEVERLNRDYPDSRPLQSPEYRAFIEYIEDKLSLDEAKEIFVRRDYQLAKRQMTWFKRNPDIQWFDSPASVLESLDN